MKHWDEVQDGLYRYVDSCIVYAMTAGDRTIVVNAGSGEWLRHADELPGRPAVVLLTHFFRDHSAGARAAAARGMEVWASTWERELLADPLGHFARRETYIIYDNGWDLFAPVEPVPVTRWLHDWEEIDLGGVTVTVVPTPGQSSGAVSYHVASGTGNGVFAGEIIHAPGKVSRVAPLQYNYNDFPGATNLLYSLDRLRRLAPDWIATSTGPALITDPVPAVDELDLNLRHALRARGVTDEAMAPATEDGLVEITPHLYQSRFGDASTYFVVSDTGEALAIDYGYRASIGWCGSHPFPRNRRPLLHGVEPLKRDLGVSRIDAVLVTHFHDDHVNGIPTLQRLYGTTCFASETFARILAQPDRFAFPCTWQEPIQVTPLSNETTHRWNEYEFSLHPMSGHTRFSALVRIDVDGERVVATGDQYFFQDSEHPGTGPTMHNHVYRNGAVLQSFRESQAVLERLDPTIILPGHGAAYRVPEALLEWTAAYRDEYEEIHRTLMPLGPDDVHFQVDSRAGWLEPYRTTIDDAAPIVYRAHVRNPFPQEAELELELVVPEGWKGSRARVTAGPRAEVEAELAAVPPNGTECRRRPVALELRGGGRTFGQVAEALVTVGGEVF